MATSKLFLDMMAEIWDSLEKNQKGAPVGSFVDQTLRKHVNAGNEPYVRFMKETLEPLAEKLYCMVMEAMEVNKAEAKTEIEEALECDSEIARGVGVDTHHASPSIEDPY